MHLYAEQRVSYGNNVNDRAAEALVCKKPVLSSSSTRTPLRSPLILDSSTVPSGVWDPFFQREG